MPQHPTCAECNAGRPNLQGICTLCDGCMRLHCGCDPCQHGKAQAEECVFCERAVVPLLDALVQADDVDADLRWLMGEQNV
jgi:hypothetical protein